MDFNSSLLASFLFWCAFGFSVGPFWITTMQAVNEMPFKTLVGHYLIYQVLGWFPLVVLISVLTGLLGGMNEQLFIVMHWLGMVVILYFCYQIITSRIKKIKTFHFDYKKMILLSSTNPKVWVMLPIGAVAAKFSDSIWLNTSLFYLSGLPIYILGFLFWCALGKLGSKVSLTKMSYFNAFLLLTFALYLGYQGLHLFLNQSPV